MSPLSVYLLFLLPFWVATLLCSLFIFSKAWRIGWGVVTAILMAGCFAVLFLSGGMDVEAAIVIIGTSPVVAALFVFVQWINIYYVVKFMRRGRNE